MAAGSEDVAIIGVGVETSGIEKGRKSLDDLAAAGGKVESAMSKVEKSTESAAKGSKALGDSTSKAVSGLNDEGVAANRLSSEMEKLRSSLESASKSQESINRNSKSAAQSFDFLGSAIRGIAIGSAVRQFIEFADAASNVRARLALVTSSAGELVTVQTELFKIAQNSRVGFNDLATTYSQIARSSKDLGVSQKDLLAATQTISQALTISGASASSANAALIQLSQGLGSGTLRGDELNSVLEQTPRLAQAIAQGLGLTTSELRKFAAEGKLTSEEVLRGLQNSAAGVAAEFSKIPPTVEQAGVTLKNSLGQAIGQFDAATGGSQALAKGIIAVADGISKIGDSIKSNEGAFKVLQAFIEKPLTGGAAIEIATQAFNKLKDNPRVIANEIETATSRILAAESSLESARASGRNTASEDIRKLQDRVKALKDYRAELQTNLANRGINPADSTDDAKLARQAAEASKRDRDAKKSAAELFEIRQKLYGQDKDYIPTLQTLKKEFDAGNLSEREYIDLASALATANYKKTASVKSLNDAFSSISDFVAAANASALTYIDTGVKQSEADKFRASAVQRVDEALRKRNITQAEALILDNQTQRAYENLNLQEERAIELARKRVDLANLRGRVDDNLASADKLANQIKQLKEENEAIGLTAAALQQLEIQRINNALAIAEESLQTAIKNGKSGEELESITLQVEELRELVKLKKQNYSLKVSDNFRKSREDEVNAWDKASDQIGQSITDALFRGFESGKGFVENLIDVTKNAFGSLVLRPTVNATVQSLASTAGQAFGIPGFGSSKNVLSGANPLTNFGGFSSDLASKAGEFLINNTTSQALGDFGASLISNSKAIGDFSSAIGDGIGYINSAVALSEGKVGQALGSAVGTYFGGPIGSAIGNEIGKFLDGLFDGSGYVSGTGSANVAIGSAGEVTSRNVFTRDFEIQTSAADAVVNGITKAFLTVGSTLGIKDFQSAFAFGSNNSDGGKFSVNAAVGGKTYATTDVKLTEEALKTEASRALLLALQGSKLPKFLEGVFDDLTVSTATTEQINAAISYAQSLAAIDTQFKALPFAELQDLSASALRGLINFSGGLDKLGTSLSSYYDNFFSAEERKVQTLKNINSRLTAAGLEIDVSGLTREAFRGIVEGQDLTTESGQKAYAALIEVSSAFAGLNPIIKETTKAVDDVADAQKKWADEVAALNKIAEDRNKAELEKRIELQERLDIATGKYTERQAAMQRELAESTDFATQSLIRQVYAQEDIAAKRADLEDIREQVTRNYLTAQERVVQAQKNLASVLQTTVKGFEDFLGTLDGAQKPTVRLAGARQSFDDLSARARAGDTAAVGQLTASAKTFLDLSKGYSASIQDYRRDEIKVRKVLQEGITAGQAQLMKLPEEMRDATDPLKAAYADLEKATSDESAARLLAIATQASLVDTEKTLGEKYLETISGLPEEDELAEFYNNTFAAADAAAVIAKASASAAQAILLNLQASAAAASAAAAAAAAPMPSGPMPKTGYTPGIGGGTFAGSAGSNVTLTSDGLLRKDSAEGTSLFWARDIAAQLNEYSDVNGSIAATARAVELGATDSILDELRKYSVGIPKFEKGINHVPYTMLAELHPGERVFPAADNSEIMKSLRSPEAANRVLAEEVKQLKLAIEKLTEKNTSENGAVVTNTLKTLKVLSKWDETGLPRERAV